MHQKPFPQNPESQRRGAISADQQATLVESPSAPDKFIGQTIAGRYEILELAGRGGMSSVYRASHILTQKIVALKLMHAHLLSDENAMRRFQQEAKAASRLHHPNAISVQDMGVTEDGQPFLTMDYLEGRSLSQEIRDCRQIEPLRCIHIFLQICSALAHAHDQRIVHRDLKPSNVMLIQSDDDPDFVKVVDFGIAKILMEGGEALKLTATGDVFGSPYYMSPEQCMGLQLDARSDIYSMGCLMYEALSGKVPHEGNNVLETMYRHTNLATPALTGIAADPRLLLRLDHVLQKCMAKVPEQRYQSMLALKDDLTELTGAPQKGSKIAAQLGIDAADKGRKFDNKLAGLSSKKLFWLAAFLVPLLMVLGAIVSSFGYYWASTAEDPPPKDRELMLNRSMATAEISEKFSIKAQEEGKTKEEVAQKTFKQFGESEQAHDTAAAVYNQFILHNGDTRTPEERYLAYSRFGFYFMRTGDYGQAIEALQKAIDTSVNNNFANALENAYLKASIAECLMSAGDGSKFDSRMSGDVEQHALEEAREAYAAFHAVDLNSQPTVLTNLGNLLELSSRRPEWLTKGFPYLQLLYNGENISPSIKAVTYYQAAQYLNSCIEHGIKLVPVPAYDQTAQRMVMVNRASSEVLQVMMDGSLKAWEQLEHKRTIRRVASYNEGVIYNHLGVMAEKQNHLDEAATNFELALQKFADNNESEAVAKVLFNLSDVRFKQRDLVAYYNNHRDARRIWDGLLHPLNLEQFRKH